MRRQFIAILAALALLAASCAPSTPRPPGVQTTRPPAPTAQRPTTRSTEAPTCTPAAKITLADAGRELCAFGAARFTYADSTASYLDFGTPFYLLSYEFDLTAVELTACVAVVGQVQQLGQHPMIIVEHAAPLYDCDSSQPIELPRFIPGATEDPPGVTNTPPTQPPPPTAPKPTPTHICDQSYPGVCIPPAPPDLDCGDIPYRRFKVLPPDPHGFDGDNDGIGCES